MICKKTFSILIVLNLFFHNVSIALPHKTRSKELGMMVSMLIATKLSPINACDDLTHCNGNNKLKNLRNAQRALSHQNDCGTQFNDGDLSIDWTIDSTQHECYKSCGSFETDSHDEFRHGFFNPTSLDDDGKFYINGYSGSEGEMTLTKEMSNLKSGVLTFRYQYAYDLTFGKSDNGKTFEVEIIEKDTHHTLYKKTDLAPVINQVLVKDSGVHYVSLPIELESNKDVEIVFRWIIPEDDSSPAQFVLDAVAFNSDSDGDKICNKNDLCPESIQDETVMIGACDTGVLNREGTDPTNGCNLSDEVQEYIDFCLEYRYDRFNSCIVRKFHKLAKINVISWSEVKKLMSCAKNYHE